MTPIPLVNPLVHVITPVTLRFPIPSIVFPFRSKLPPNCGVVSSTTFKVDEVRYVLLSTLPSAFKNWEDVPLVVDIEPAVILPVAAIFPTTSNFSAGDDELIPIRPLSPKITLSLFLFFFFNCGSFFYFRHAERSSAMLFIRKLVLQVDSTVLYVLS